MQSGSTGEGEEGCKVGGRRGGGRVEGEDREEGELWEEEAKDERRGGGGRHSRRMRKWWWWR